MILLDGKKTSQELKEEIAAEVAAMRQQGHKVPHLAAVIVGNDGASLTYVSSKVRSCEQVGFESTLVRLPEDTTQEDLLKEVATLNANEAIDGYIVQLPLPAHLDEEEVLLAIDPKKDVDGFHPTNFGRMALELESFIPATPFGIM
jgi:methylenetetrahydrofolate dehydrogenase (NADP+)/methenyltetrahydrofolate cyclohydrolase